MREATGTSARLGNILSLVRVISAERHTLAGHRRQGPLEASSWGRKYLGRDEGEEMKVTHIFSTGYGRNDDRHDRDCDHHGKEYHDRKYHYSRSDWGRWNDCWSWQRCR